MCNTFHNTTNIFTCIYFLIIYPLFHAQIRFFVRFALDQHLYASHGQNKLKTETVSEPEARLDIYDKSKKQNAKQKQIHVAASNTAYNDFCALLRVPLSTFRCRRRHRRHCGCSCRQCCSNRSSLRMLNKTICMRLSVPITNLAYCLSLFI